ncbi:DUF4365 domain-containing protein [Kitasatospora sp. NPDC059646]|uniref:DUF4365 domain-containing protein n=1 Tax=Kitasatospora sp. NPDC059646 TaxID=3346893 RepID=UPI00368838BE
MPKVPESRRVERMAVNEVRALLERHGHIVQEIDGGNDFGEDLHVTFVQDGRRTADAVAIQVKGGTSTRTRRGHRVRIGTHGDNWRDGIPPVLCVVHDPERGGLFWAHATRQLRRAQALRKTPKSIVVQAESLLDDHSLPSFVESIRTYLRWERQGVARWADMADVEFAHNDTVKSFVNDCGEPMVFQQGHGKTFAVLLHHDLDWEPFRITESMLHLEPLPMLGPIPKIGGIVLDSAEAHWLTACFKTTEWTRSQAAKPAPATE